MEIRNKVTGRTTEYACAVVEACSRVFAAGITACPESISTYSRNEAGKDAVKKFLEML